MNARLSTLVLVGLAACSGNSSSAPKDPVGNAPPAPPAGKVSVSLASVTLAEDCGTAPTTAPPSPVGSPVSGAPALQDSSGDMAPARAASVARSQMKRACMQSSVQLVVTNTTAAAATIKVKSVSVLDSSGATVAQLTSYEPSRWADDTYVPWDGSIGAGAAQNVAYSLSAPTVNAGELYTVRIVVETAGGETTVETKAAMEVVEGPASLPPGAVT